MPTRTSRRPSDPALDAKARRLSDNLRRLHRLGQQANADRNDLSTDEFAAEHGLNANTMRKARAYSLASDWTDGGDWGVAGPPWGRDRTPRCRQDNSTCRSRFGQVIACSASL